MLWTEGALPLRSTIAGRSPLSSGWRGRPGRADRSITNRASRRAAITRLRTAMIQLAWLWPQPSTGSALARWFVERTKGDGQGCRGRRWSSRWRASCSSRCGNGSSAGVVIEGAVHEERRQGELRTADPQVPFFTIRRGPINLGRSGSANRWIAWPERRRSEEWTRPPEPTACESGIRVRSLQNATTECEFVLARRRISKTGSNPGSKAKRQRTRRHRKHHP